MTTTRYLIIDKTDEVYLKIEADADIRRELGEYFTFEVPGFKFMPQFRNRVWDGKIRLFSYATGKIYTGLYNYILNWCNENNVQVVQNVAGANSQAPQVQQQQAGGNPYLTQHTPPQGGPQEQSAQGFEGLSNAMMPMATEPMAANSGFGAFSGF